MFKEETDSEVGHYIPGEDEPSPFGGLHQNPSNEWLYWYRYNFKDSGNPFKAGEELIKRLLNEERTRDYSKVAEYVIKRNGKSFPLLEEIIDLSYLKGISMEEAHKLLVNLPDGYSEKIFVTAGGNTFFPNSNAIGS